MPNYGSLKNLAMSMGRTLFGFNINSNQKLADIAKQTGIDKNDISSIASASDEAIQQVLDRGALQSVIDPRDANAIKIQMAKDAQEVVPEYNDLFGGLE